MINTKENTVLVENITIEENLNLFHFFFSLNNEKDYEFLELICDFLN